MNKYQNRLVGDVPKIGIRPTIDGRRRGVRDLLDPRLRGGAGRYGGRHKKKPK